MKDFVTIVNKRFVITFSKLITYTLYLDYTILKLLIFSQINVLTAEQVFNFSFLKKWQQIARRGMVS